MKNVCFLNVWALNTGVSLRQIRPGNTMFKFRNVYYEIYTVLIKFMNSLSEGKSFPKLYYNNDIHHF